jgi:hypothetical protein
VAHAWFFLAVIAVDELDNGVLKRGIVTLTCDLCLPEDPTILMMKSAEDRLSNELAEPLRNTSVSRSSSVNNL